MKRPTRGAQQPPTPQQEHPRGKLTLPDPSELLLTASKAAALIGRSRWTFYRAGIDRAIPCIVVGGTRMWHRRDVEEWAERARQRAHQQEAS